jgi:magnesium-transporting ATPase (P-type)
MASPTSTTNARSTICTDKTGTLTRNEMSVIAVWTPAGPATITGEGYEPVGTVDVDLDAGRHAVPVRHPAAPHVRRQSR